MSDDLALRIRGARPRAVATAAARDRARAAALDSLGPGTARRTTRIALAVTGLATAAAVAAGIFALTLGGGGDPAPRILLPGDTDPAASAAPAAGTVRVPDLVGRGDTEARRLLGDLGLRTVAVMKGAVPGGRAVVTAQEPDPGTDVRDGSVVRVDLGEPDDVARAPDFDMPLLRGGGLALGGDRATLTALRGEVVVLAFSASWCSPCRRALVDVGRATAASDHEGVTTLVVATRDTRENAQRAHRNVAALALDTTGDVARAYGAGAVPEVVVIGRDGRIAARFPGRVRPARLEAAVRRLISEPRPPGPRVETPLDTAAFDGPPLETSELPTWALRAAPCEIYPDRVWAAGDQLVARGPRDSVALWTSSGGSCAGARGIAIGLRGKGITPGSISWNGRFSRIQGIVARRVSAVVVAGVRTPTPDGVFVATGPRRLRTVTVVTPTGEVVRRVR